MVLLLNVFLFCSCASVGASPIPVPVPGIISDVWDQALFLVFPKRVAEDSLRTNALWSNWENVRRLLKNPYLDPASNNQIVLHRAIVSGRIEIVKELLNMPRIDPARNDNEAIKLAAGNDNVEILEMLLKDPRVDPTANDNEALRVARQYNRHENLERMLADERVIEKLPHLTSKPFEEGSGSEKVAPATDNVLNAIPRFKITSSSPLKESQQQETGRKIGIPLEKGKKNLIVEDDAECTICFHSYTDGSLVSLLPCKHHADTQCMERWLKIRAGCPTCRTILSTSPLAASLPPRLSLAEP